MNSISVNTKEVYNEAIWADVERKYGIIIRSDIKDFLKLNNGGYPKSDIIVVDDSEYEVRVFLSLDKNDENYCIEKPLEYFLNRTKGKIVPVAIDSGDNYYCVNNETGKVYYWNANSDSYYLIAEGIAEFTKLF